MRQQKYLETIRSAQGKAVMASKNPSRARGPGKFSDGLALNRNLYEFLSDVNDFPDETIKADILNKLLNTVNEMLSDISKESDSAPIEEAPHILGTEKTETANELPKVRNGTSPRSDVNAHGASGKNTPSNDNRYTDESVDSYASPLASNDPDNTSYLILFLLDNSVGRPVNLVRLWLACQKAGLSIKRPSLNSKLNRWKNPHIYSNSSGDRPLVTWSNPKRREITDAGREELRRLSLDIDPAIKAHLEAVAKAS